MDKTEVVSNVQRVADALSVELKEVSGRDWEVEIRQVNWDVQYRCKLDGILFQSRCLDLMTLNSYTTPEHIHQWAVDGWHYWNWRKEHDTA